MSFEDHFPRQDSRLFDFPEESSAYRSPEDDSEGVEIHSQGAWAAWGVGILFVLLLAILPGLEYLRSATPSVLLLSLIPFSWFLVLLFFFPKDRSFFMTEKGIRDTASGKVVLFENVRQLMMGGRNQVPELGKLQRGNIFLADGNEELLIPRSGIENIVDLFTRIHRTVPITGRGVEAAPLARYAGEMKELFGTDKVFEYSSGRKANPIAAGTKALFCWAIATFLSGIPVVAWSGGNNLSEGMGITALFVGGITFVIAGIAMAAHRTRRWTIFRSEIVISPKGIALDHGPLRGVLRWDEIKHIGFLGIPTKGTRPGRNILAINVAGATILVPDVFERPLSTVVERLLRYWRP